MKPQFHPQNFMLTAHLYQNDRPNATKEEKEKWLTAIKKVIGYANMFDYYQINNTLGKGKFGLVKSAIHKKTGKTVAVKVMSKKEMSV